jgi:hypothetical protein
MRQLLHPRCSALRTIIAATIMIIANATTAWGGLTVYTDPEGYEYLVSVEEGSTRIYVEVPAGASVISVTWYENDPHVVGGSVGSLAQCENSYMGYYTAPQPNGYVVVTFSGIAVAFSIPYIDANGNEASCEKFTVLNGSEDKLTNNVDTDNDGTLDQGWYVVNVNINYTNTLYLDGDIHLILCDGKKMSVKPKNDYNTYAVSAETGANLTIYGQTNQSGRLEAYSESLVTIFFDRGNYTQHGGDVFLTNTFFGRMYALVVNGTEKTGCGNVTLSRGKLTASATREYGIAIGANNNMNILGGQLDAQGGNPGNNADGISAVGNITLGWTTAKDRIKASSYHAGGTVKIVKGQALVDQDEGTNYAVGDGNALSDDALSAFAGKTLKPALLLTDNADNSAQVAALDEFETTAILQGRTLYKDGDWNTLCLPFNVSTASGPLSGNNVEAKVLRPSDSGLSGSTLTLNFDNASEPILAGTPFIVKWDNTGENITNPVFQDVTIDNSADAIARMTQPSTDGTVSFKGTYAWQEYTTENQSILLLGTNNQLFWPKPDGDNKPSIGACRAYFELSDGTSAREFVLTFGEVETSSLPQPLQKEGSQNAAWYTLDGRKLDAKPTKKGLYIVNGRKIIIK